MIKAVENIKIQFNLKNSTVKGESVALIFNGDISLEKSVISSDNASSIEYE